MQEDPVIEIIKLSHWFGDHRVLHELEFAVARGQIVALVGPSGCGKSTLLRAIVGTHPPKDGSVAIVAPDGSRKVVTSPGRDRGIVYQKYALFPHLTALENVAEGLKLGHTTLLFRIFQRKAWKKLRAEHFEAARTLLQKVGLGHALERYPHELSGGMQQRVSIAQALVMKPSILLLDEPFGALDEATREDLQRMLLTLYAENLEARMNGDPEPYTILIVTHELNEALFVSDRILGLSQHWDWKTAGYDICPGARILHDTPAPVFDPDSERDYAVLLEHKRQILDKVFAENRSTGSG